MLFRINGKYCNWEKAAPILVSMIAYKSLVDEPVAETKESSPLNEPIKKQTAFIRKSLVLTSEQLKNLGLKPGINDVMYEVNSRLQGIQQVHSKIYLWH